MHNTLKRLIINFTSIFSANFISRFLAFIYFTILARYLTTQEMGLYGYLFVYIGVGNILTDFGINRILVRDVARDHSLAQNYLKHIVTLRMFLSLVSAILLYLIILMLPKDTKVLLLAPLALLSIFPYSLSFTLDYTLKAREKMRSSAISMISFESLKILLLLLVIWLDFRLIGILSMLILAFILYCLILYSFISQDGLRLGWGFSLPAWKNILTASLPFALFNVMEIIHSRLNLFLLKNLLNDDVITGYYFIAYQFIVVILILPAASSIVIQPMFSRHFALSTDKIHNEYILFLKIMSVLGLFIAIMVFIFSDFIIVLAFGTKYIPSINILKILTISIFFLFLQYANSAFLIASDIKWRILIFSLLQLSINFISNLVLIPKFGAVGAAWAHNISTAGGFILFSIMIRLYMQSIRSSYNNNIQV